MSSDSKFFLGIAIGAIVIIGAIVFFTSKSSNSTSSSGANEPNINVTDGHKRGAGDSAPIKIVEFGDFQCPFCGEAEAPLRATVTANSSDVELIFRNFPLPQHQNALPAAYAAEAANKQGKYWPMHDMLYDKQNSWDTSTDPEAIFTSYASQLGLNTAQFKSDYASSAVKQTVQADLNYGQSLNVDETPTFFINGKRVTGPQTTTQWQTLIAAAKK